MQINQNSIKHTPTTAQEAKKTKIELQIHKTINTPLKRKIENKGSFNFSQNNKYLQ